MCVTKQTDQFLFETHLHHLTWQENIGHIPLFIQTEMTDWMELVWPGQWIRFPSWRCKEFLVKLTGLFKKIFKVIHRYTSEDVKEHLGIKEQEQQQEKAVALFGVTGMLIVIWWFS